MLIRTAASALLAITLGAPVALPPAHAQQLDRGSMGRGAVRGPVVASPPAPRPMLSPAADQFRVDRRTPGQWTPGPSQLPVVPPPSRHPGFDPGRPGHRPVHYGPYAPGVILYGYPVYYPVEAYATPPAYDPAPAYGAPGGGAPTASPGGGPTVIEFANGRYELRGDGVSLPYAWVWIPNAPPPPPPPPAPPATVAVPPAAPSGPASAQAPRQSRLYRWVDAEGVAHWTDREDAVPPEYRAQASRDRRL